MATDQEIEYVRAFVTERFGIGASFTLAGWKEAHLGDEDAPRAQGLMWVRELIEKNDPRLDFLELDQGAGRDGVIGAVNNQGARYYRRVK